jgi:hypothetical protein
MANSNHLLRDFLWQVSNLQSARALRDRKPLLAIALVNVECSKKLGSNLGQLSAESRVKPWSGTLSESMRWHFRSCFETTRGLKFVDLIQ